MATTLEQLAEQAMALPSESRAQLADLLVESLEGDDLGRIELFWLAEAKRRRNEVRSQIVKTVPGEEALRKVRDSIGGGSMSSTQKLWRNTVKQLSGMRNVGTRSR